MLKRDLIWAGVCVILLFLYIGTCSNNKKVIENNIDLNNRVLNWNKRIKFFRNDLNQVVTRNNVLEISNAKQLLQINSNDSVIIKLQNEIKRINVKKTGSVTYIETVTKVPTIKIKLKVDTLYVDNTKTFDLYQKFNYTEKWLSLSGSINENLLVIDSIQIFNETIVSIYNKKTGWFKTEPVVELTQINPYSTATSLVTVNIKPLKPKKLGIGISTGLYYNISTQAFKPYLGVGLNYNLIELR